ncbi:MAG: hypothetical protein IPI73_23890 [Betaproteobacteria bacterium]|nr:hypothetical protein [Betaproteobacteria bacterium]
MNPSKYSQTRRLFLQRSVALGAAGMAPLVYQLEAIAAAAAQNVEPRVDPKAGGGGVDLSAAAPNYKALVCLFMYGGNDNANFIIPYDQAEYDKYALDRTNLAVARTGDPTVQVTAQPTNMNLRRDPVGRCEPGGARWRSTRTWARTTSPIPPSSATTACRGSGTRASWP